VNTLPTLSPARSRRPLALLMLVFFAPLLVASALYYASGWRPAGHTNHGALIEPALALPGALFQGKWSLVYVGAGGCDADCQHALYYMRQTHLGLGRLYTRTQRVFVATTRCCDRQLTRAYPDLVTLDASSETMQPLLQNFPSAQRRSSLFVVDPRGNLMMRYDLHDPPRGLLDDLKHLLGLSSIG